jgi:hypothetical protein
MKMTAVDSCKSVRYTGGVAFLCDAVGTVTSKFLGLVRPLMFVIERYLFVAWQG